MEVEAITGNKSVFYNYFFECLLKDTLTLHWCFSHQHFETRILIWHGSPPTRIFISRYFENKLSVPSHRLHFLKTNVFALFVSQDQW